MYYITVIKKEEIISNLYLDGSTCQDIAIKFKISRNTVSKILKQNGVLIKGRRGYCLFNKRFFDDVDSEEKAYFLGLLFADGYNQERRTGGNVRICLKYSDYDILNQLCKSISHKNKPTLNSVNQWIVTMCSSHFSKRCSELGCHQNKSLTLKYPNKTHIPKEIFHHFIRGYFDGDGCVSSSGTPTITIVSSEHFCDGLNKELSAIIGLKKISLHPNKITRRYRFSGRKQIEKFYTYLYQDATIFLQRKKDIFSDILLP